MRRVGIDWLGNARCAWCVGNRASGHRATCNWMEAEAFPRGLPFCAPRQSDRVVRRYVVKVHLQDLCPLARPIVHHLVANAQLFHCHQIASVSTTGERVWRRLAGTGQWLSRAVRHWTAPAQPSRTGIFRDLRAIFVGASICEFQCIVRLLSVVSEEV